MKLQGKSVDVFADYHQFYPWDKGVNPRAPENYSDQDVSRKLKTAPHVVVVQPERNDTVPVTIEIHDSEPAYKPGDWDHIVECGLEMETDNLQVHERTGGPVAEFKVKPGAYRVRAFFGKLSSKGKDHYHVVIWPASFSELKVLKQYGA